MGFDPQPRPHRAVGTVRHHIRGAEGVPLPSFVDVVGLRMIRVLLDAGNGGAESQVDVTFERSPSEFAFHRILIAQQRFGGARGARPAVRQRQTPS